MLNQNMQNCVKCCEDKPLTEFYVSKPDRYYTWCKSCCNERSRAYRVANPDAFRDRHLKRDYGISLEEYKAMLDAQGRVCKICEQPDRKALSVDHCHRTGKVRGLLCTRCNNLVGKADEKIPYLENAIKYLKDHYNL